MATYSDVITRAYSKAGIKASETPITSEELDDGYDILVDMLNEWQDSGIPLGFIQSQDKTEDIAVQKVAMSAIKSGLAVRLASELGRAITPGMAANATTAYDSMLTSLIQVKGSSMPGNLPKGSGNWDIDIQDFYPEPDEKNF